MDIREVLISQHARTHSSAMALTDLSLEDMLLQGLSDDQIRLRPREDLNSIAWYLWHMARTEDVAVNLIVAEHDQVIDEGDWPFRMRIGRRDIGTGMTSREVTSLSAEVNVAELRAYRVAVGRRTREILQNFRAEELGKAVDTAHMSKVAAARAFGSNAGWMAGFWEGRPKEFFLSFTVIGHSFTQLGEAWVIREMLIQRS